MNSVARYGSSLFRRPVIKAESHSCEGYEYHPFQQQQQWRGIRVKVLDGNLERALTWMQRKMQSSGMERLIKNEQIHHIKNSEKRILARKKLEQKIKSQDLARKLKSILVRKVRLLLEQAEKLMKEMEKSGIKNQMSTTTINFSKIFAKYRFTLGYWLSKLSFGESTSRTISIE